MGDTSHTVGAAARLAGITVRALHHYDRIGLVRPSGRTSGGYRRYSTRDVERLHRVLSYRELGIPLKEIAALLDDPDADPSDHLLRQEELLRERIGRLEEMLAARQIMLEAHEMNMDLSPEDRFALFGDFDPANHAREARTRWGDSHAYRQSTRRTAAYTRTDWVRIQEESRRIEQDLARAMTAGVPASDEAAQGLAEAHRMHIDRWFYDCGPAAHRRLGEMYVADPRFRAHHDEIAPGLAAWVRDAIAANADA